MIHLTFRATSFEDEGFYRACFENAEFAKMLYYPNGMDINAYIAKSINDHKFVVLYKNEKIGFVHFYYNSKLNKYTYVGGLHPSKFNTGLGVYISVCILDYFFSQRKSKEIFSGVYSYNIRSYRMMKAIGFETYGISDDKILMTLSVDDFSEKEFVDKIKRRVSYSML